MKKLKPIPTFKTESEEQIFWQTADSTEYIDWERASNMQIPNLHKTSRNISVTLPVDMIEKLKVQAHKINVPYQSLIKLYLSKQLAEEI
jgi:predicted DNA binding CopG/RHH family protein